MGTNYRAMPGSIINELFEECGSFNFFQAVSLLEREYCHPGQVGQATGKNNLFFQTDNSHAFPKSDISSIDITPDNVLTMRMAFLGLYGICSPLPAYFSDPLITEEGSQSALRAFLDIFGHRVYALFYRAWKKYRLQAQWVEGPNPVLDMFQGLLGQQSTAPGSNKLQFMTSYINRTRSARSLEDLLKGYLRTPHVKVLQFIARWLDNPNKVALGQSPYRLGGDTVLGHSIQHVGAAFRVEIGPLPYDEYSKFLPNSSGKHNEAESLLTSQVKDLIKGFLRDPLDFDIMVYVNHDDQAPAGLGDDRTRLGVCTWLGQVPAEHVGVRLAG